MTLGPRTRGRVGGSCRRGTCRPALRDLVERRCTSGVLSPTPDDGTGMAIRPTRVLNREPVRRRTQSYGSSLPFAPLIQRVEHSEQTKMPATSFRAEPHFGQLLEDAIAFLLGVFGACYGLIRSEQAE